MKSNRRAVWIALILVLIAVPCVLTCLAVRQEQLDRSLMFAIKRNEPNAVLKALHAGASPNCRNSSSATGPIWKVLLEYLRGNRKNSTQGDTALSVAISMHEQYDNSRGTLVVPYEDTRVIRMLVEAGADPNLRSIDGSNPILQAVEWTDVRTVRLLLDHNGAVDLKDKDGTTPLMIAVGKPTIRIALMLMERGANVEATDNDGRTPLMHAARQGTPDMMRCLLRYHPDIAARDNKGMTALQHAKAAFNSHAERILKTAGSKR